MPFKPSTLGGVSDAGRWQSLGCNLRVICPVGCHSTPKAIAACRVGIEHFGNSHLREPRRRGLLLFLRASIVGGLASASEKLLDTESRQAYSTRVRLLGAHVTP